VSTEDAAVSIAVGNGRAHENAVTEIELELVGCRAGLLHAERNERRRPGILVQRGVQVPAAAACFVVVGNAAAQWFVALVGAIEAVELRLGDDDDGSADCCKRRDGERRRCYADLWRRNRVRDLQVSIDVLAVEVGSVVVPLLQFSAFPEIAEAGIVDDRNKGGFSISKRLLVAEVELIQPSFKLGHQLVDTRLDTLPALLQEEIRIAAEELQVVLEDAVAMHKLVRPACHGLIGFDASGIGHLHQ
jgi:hypothetical protein